MKRTPLGCLIVILAVIGGCSVPYIWHNCGLSRFQGSFRAVGHPASSRLLAQFAEVGMLGGNGNHCDYLVGEVRESDRTVDEIKQHYTGLKVARVDPSAYDNGFGTHVPVEIEFPDSESYDPTRFLSSAIPGVVPAAGSKRIKTTVYVVFAFDAGYGAYGDVRCH
jgi:hypothetical protein